MTWWLFILAYIAVAGLFGQLFQYFDGNPDDCFDVELRIFASVFWPVTIVGLAVYLLICLIVPGAWKASHDD